MRDMRVYKSALIEVLNWKVFGDLLVNTFLNRCFDLTTIQIMNRLTYTKENKLGLDAYEMFNTWNKNP